MRKPTGRQVLVALKRSGKFMFVNPVTGAIINRTKLSKIGDAKQWLDKGKCPVCHKGLVRSWFSSPKMHPNCARDITLSAYGTLEAFRKTLETHGSDGRPKTGIRWRTHTTRYGAEGSRLFPHDPDYHDH